MSARLTVLGAGSILPRAGYGSSGYALEAVPGGPLTLLDCGPGSLRSLGALGLALERVVRVVFSHYHLDHCLDLFALAFARHNPRFDTDRAIDVVGPHGLKRLLTQAPLALGRYAELPGCRATEIALDTAGRGAFEVEGLRFSCAKNDHNKESVSWRVQFPDGRVLVYTGDTNECDALVQLARGADLLVAECSFPDETATANHLSPTSAARVARRAEVGRLVLTHFYPELDPEEARQVAHATFDGPIELARDGSVHEI